MVLLRRVIVLLLGIGVVVVLVLLLRLLLQCGHALRGKAHSLLLQLLHMTGYLGLKFA